MDFKQIDFKLKGINAIKIVTNLQLYADFLKTIYNNQQIENGKEQAQEFDPKLYDAILTADGGPALLKKYQEQIEEFNKQKEEAKKIKDKRAKEKKLKEIDEKLKKHEDDFFFKVLSLDGVAEKAFAAPSIEETKEKATRNKEANEYLMDAISLFCEDKGIDQSELSMTDINTIIKNIAQEKENSIKELENFF